MIIFASEAIDLKLGHLLKKYDAIFARSLGELIGRSFEVIIASHSVRLVLSYYEI